MAIYAVLTAVTFLVWGYDKLRAVNNQWRVPESVLFTLTFIGGAFGALAGMLVFRHKTRKLHFWILVALACVLHGAILILFFKPS